MTVVTMPDGVAVDFGDMPPDEIKALILKKFPDAAERASEMSSDDMVQLSVDKSNAPMNQAEDFWRSVATGAAEGTIGLATMPGDVATLIGQGAAAVGGVFGASPETQENLANTVRRTVPIFGGAPNSEEASAALQHDKWAHDPQYTTGEYGRTAGQFIPGAVAFGPASGVKGAISNAVKYGVAPAIASEAAGQGAQAVWPEVEPYARLLGALGGAAGVAIITKPNTAQTVLAGKLPRGVTASDIDDAARLIQTGQRMGVDLTWPEALKRATNGRVDLTGVQRVVEQSQGGQQVMAPYMAARPGQVAQAGAGAMDDITRGAALTSPDRAGLAVQKASAGTLDKLRQRINDTTRKLYAAADIDMVDDAAYTAISRDPVFQDALAAVRELPEHSRFIAGLPDRSVGVFNEVKKYLDDIAGSRATSGKNQASSVYGGVARDVRDAAKASSPDYEKALTRQSQLRESVLKPAEAGPLGGMAETDDILQQGRRLLPAAPAEGSEKVVAQTVRRLVLKDPRAAFQLVRTNLRQQFDEAIQANQTGPNEFGGAKFAAAVRGNPQQAKNLEAAIKALPDGNARWAAFNDFLTVMETTGARLPANSATAFNQAIQQSLKETGTAAKIATGTRTFGKSVLEAWETFKAAKNGEALAEIFTDRSGRTKMLLKSLAAAKAPSRKAQIAALLVYYAGEAPRQIPSGGR